MPFWGWQFYYRAAVIKRWRDRQERMWANHRLPLQIAMNTAFRQTHVVLPYCIISRISVAAFALALKHFLLVDYEKRGKDNTQNDSGLLKHINYDSILFLYPETLPNKLTQTM